MHVDDLRITASTHAVCIAFVTAWRDEFHEDVDVAELSENFIGLRMRRVGDTCEISAAAVIDNLVALVAPLSPPAGMNSSYLLGADALRAAPRPLNPLVPARAPLARQLVGTTSWVSGARHDSLFAARV